MNILKDSKDEYIRKINEEKNKQKVEICQLKA